MHAYQRATLSIAFLTLLLTGGLSAGVTELKANEKIGEASNREELILETFENEDYDNWKKHLSRKTKLVEAVSREDFNNFIEARKLARAGNYELAISMAEGLEAELKLKFLEQIVA